ncbi:diguanylate cyclase [Crocosphaera sp. UHCC 0190]|uniref:diguanylate cyclase domain-containing protein n=1 Tax=Crocosphaera sp. UHCC 0190 TaxID=3110246 RepID=UPI002B2177F1|nr:diguanylate cyclase [Crocosphaera sp. UHCC 0190]MEA5510623.1 diguanylate cyclase [Crocosphaera sp. UHCC 0190]
MKTETPYQANILIVEDQLDNLRLLSNILQDQGYQVRQAIDGEMALLAAETQPPDLMLLDIKLPQLDGYQVCQQLKAKKNTAEIPVIFLSAFDQIGEKVKAFEMGGVDYITKPYQLEEVLARVENQVKISLSSQQLKGNNSQLKQQLKLTEAAQQFYSQPQIEAYLLHQAVAATHNGIIITDATHPDYPIMYVNPGFEKMTGYSLKEVKGKNCRFLQGSDRHQPQIEQLHHRIAEGKACCVILRNYRKDGSLFWNEVSLSPVLDESEKVIYYIGVQTDVSTRKRAEEEQQRYEASLNKMNRELHDLNYKLHRLANLDGLTEVANRRCFDETLEQEWRRLAREKKPLSLILGDIDYFKRYNDTYGHLGGDDCLKKVAKAIANTALRPADLVARYGGEEFAVILPETPHEGATQVAQRILEGIRALNIPHKASDVQPYVTMSLGVATMIPSLELDLKSLIDSADDALFKAKKQGRDQVVNARLS